MYQVLNWKRFFLKGNILEMLNCHDTLGEIPCDLMSKFWLLIDPESPDINLLNSFICCVIEQQSNMSQHPNILSLKTTVDAGMKKEVMVIALSHLICYQRWHNSISSSNMKISFTVILFKYCYLFMVLAAFWTLQSISNFLNLNILKH